MMRLVITVPSGFILDYSKKKLRTVMRRAGAEVAATARSLIRASAAGGRYYGVRLHGGLELHQASAPGQPPASITGQLASSIRAKPTRSGLGVTVQESQFYGKFLETGARGGRPGHRNRRIRQGGLTTVFPVGTRVLASRPYLSAALEQKEASIEERVKESVLLDIEFKAQRA